MTGKRLACDANDNAPRIVLCEKLQRTETHKEAFVKAQVPLQRLDAVPWSHARFTTLHLRISEANLAF